MTWVRTGRPTGSSPWLDGRGVAVLHITAAKYVELPAGGHLMAALDPIEEFVTGRLPKVAVDRVLATILFTDIVDSTAHAAALGDRAWRHRLDEHEALVRRQLARFRGRVIRTMGDGFLATFDGPARAIRCGSAFRDEARQLGIELRAGLHAGEIELRSDDIAGMTVNIAARVTALAGPAEVLVFEDGYRSGGGLHRFADRTASQNTQFESETGRPNAGSAARSEPALDPCDTLRRYAPSGTGVAASRSDG